MNESTHVMLRLLSDDAGLGAPVEARYGGARKRRAGKFSVRQFATALSMLALAILARGK